MPALDPSSHHLLACLVRPSMPCPLQVLLDETVMAAGTLQEVGLRNMAVRGWCWGPAWGRGRAGQCRNGTAVMASTARSS